MIGRRAHIAICTPPFRMLCHNSMSAVLEEKLAGGGSEKRGMEDTRVRNRMIDGMGIVEVVGIAGSIPLLRYSCQSVST